MHYAKTNCRRTYNYGDDTVEYSGPCVCCGKNVTVTVYSSDMVKYNDGELIQTALRNPVGEREFLMSGLCSECFDTIC